MDFGSDRQKPKAWKEIWGCGQGIGVLRDVPPAAELIARWEQEYAAAQREWLQRLLPQSTQAA
jgi:nitronate monooxygenase